jgi:uncharacterized membrane protein YqjE
MMSDRLHVDVENGATDLTTEPKRPEMSLGELFSEMTSDVSTLFRKEIELAKVEAREEVGRTKQAAVMFGIAGVSALLALAMLSTALAWWLDEAMHPAVAFAIVGALWLIVAAIAASAGRKRLKDMQGLPKTKQTIKEDVEWAKQQKS